MKLRIGTRGSDLALIQTRTVCSLINQHHPHITFEEVIIRTHGDLHAAQPVTDADWPMGGFVGAIERALLAGEIDLAVHSYKDMPTQATAGLSIVAVPKRGPVHDVLVMSEGMKAKRHEGTRGAPSFFLPAGLRIGTSSPRRAAQIRQFGDCEVVPIRGNVPTRIRKVEAGELDGVILAAAGLHRLELSPVNAIELPKDRCLPAPGQGALAVQMREGDERTELIREIHDAPSARSVQAERALLREVGAGCATPLGALANLKEGAIVLRGQLFDEGGIRQVTSTVRGEDPLALGRQLGGRLMDELSAATERET